MKKLKYNETNPAVLDMLSRRIFISHLPYSDKADKDKFGHKMKRTFNCPVMFNYYIN